MGKSRVHGVGDIAPDKVFIITLSAFAQVRAAGRWRRTNSTCVEFPPAARRLDQIWHESISQKTTSKCGLFLTRSLEKIWHKICAVGEDFAALQHITNDDFDRLAADIVMPGMVGLGLARCASAEFPELKVISNNGFAAAPLDNK